MSAANNGTNWERPQNPWAMPAGRQIASASVERDVWLDLRTSMICASDLAALVGASKWGDQFTVWADKTKRSAPDPTSDAQARGLIFEDAVIELWIQRYADFPVETRRMGLVQSRSNVHAGATVDRLSICPLGRCVIEAKTQANVGEWFDEGDEYVARADDEVPVAYQFQGQWQLFVTGRHHVHYVVMGPRWQPIHRIMFRDEELIAELNETVTAWWEQHIVLDVRPPATHVGLSAAKRLALPSPGSRVVIDDELAMHVHAAKDAAAMEKAYGDEKNAAMANIFARMGSATELVWPDGTVAMTWNPGKTIDGADAKWRKAHPELVAAYSVPGPDVLDLPKLVANHPELIDNRELRQRRTTSWK